MSCKTCGKEVDILKIGCFTHGMKTYSQIFTDFRNTTRLRFKTFWHGLKCKIEERRQKEEEILKGVFQKISTKIFDKFN